jgi:hypothetical protein
MFHLPPHTRTADPITYKWNQQFLQLHLAGIWVFPSICGSLTGISPLPEPAH